MQESEIWKPIIGYEGLYEVSNLGRVKSKLLSHYDINSKQIVNFVREKILKCNANGRGYCVARLTKGGEAHYIYVHQLVAKAFIPNPNGYKIVNHIDSNPLNNRAENLEWCTQQHNMEHAAIAHRMTSKLREKDVLDIRERFENGEPYKSIYLDYPQVYPKTIRNVVNMKTWRWLCKNR